MKGQTEALILLDAVRGMFMEHSLRKEADFLPEAKAQLRAIYKRRDFFGHGISDVGCAILLDLLINAHRPVSVSDACLGSGAPPTTALRCLTILIDRGMIARSDDPDDGRRVFVSLTNMGREAVVGWLAAI